jgi:hypothetical protein
MPKISSLALIIHFLCPCQVLCGKPSSVGPPPVLPPAPSSTSGSIAYLLRGLLELTSLLAMPTRSLHALAEVHDLKIQTGTLKQASSYRRFPQPEHTHMLPRPPTAARSRFLTSWSNPVAGPASL